MLSLIDRFELQHVWEPGTDPSDCLKNHMNKKNMLWCRRQAAFCTWSGELCGP